MSRILLVESSIVSVRLAMQILVNDLASGCIRLLRALCGW